LQKIIQQYERSMIKYKRSLEELRTKAVLHWPDEINKGAIELSVLPLLLNTQDEFISLLKLSNRHPESWKKMLPETATLNGPLFIKHLMVMTDLGGEALNKLPPLANYFPCGVLEYDWKGALYKYKFSEIGNKCSLANSALKVDSKNILKGGELTNKMIDVVMLLLYASSSVADTLPMEVKDRCVIGSMIGNPDDLDKFAKENYLRVSRQVGGATSNALGQITQDYVINILEKKLPCDWLVTRDMSLPNVAHTTDGNGTNFDIVVKSPQGKYFGIEVSFQVTTNSVIERKARESESLISSVHKAGHKICYVIDGAGNINIRKNAVSILCKNSDCTVALSEPEIGFLADFMKENSR
jgi:hypothetical protein